MIHISISEKGPTPQLAEVIAKQKAEGGYIIQYLRTWSALVVTQTQNRVAHVPFGQSRVLPGLKHSLFTLFLGIWSPAGLMHVPLILIVNLRGGMDVTADFSTTSVDPMRDLPPTPGQGARDLKVSQWVFVTLGGATVLWVIWYFAKNVWQ